MTNKEIAGLFNDLAGLMELHEENKFKIRSYQNAYLTLRKLPDPLVEMDQSEIEEIKGVGKAISSKIQEIIKDKQLSLLNTYKEKTPLGIQEMLRIKGFGPKKIRQLWEDLGVETIGELLYAVNENRLIELKGFGLKTQEDLKNKLKYFQQSKDKFHYASLEEGADDLLDTLEDQLPGAIIGLTGAMRRKDIIVQQIEILIGHDGPIDGIFDTENLILAEQKEQLYLAKTEHNKPVAIYHCKVSEFGSKQFYFTGSDQFVKDFLKTAKIKDFKHLKTEAAVFEKAGLQWIEPELRDHEQAITFVKNGREANLVEQKDIKGVLHAHSTYSDGLNSIEEMALFAQEQGYQYLGLTDHSKSAFYANGLKIDRLEAQWKEIDELNKKLAPFKIFKGIESDIINDGSLDYKEDILKRFDFIIASIHTNLKMDIDKATNRLITAIENPYTNILGHPTGRLLLSREAYPIDHKKIIDACAENGVAIELNANPYRLDIDWKWIPYAMEKEVKIAINPDAHSTTGILDIHYGICAARKGGLTKPTCLNTMEVDEFAKWVM